MVTPPVAPATILLGTQSVSRKGDEKEGLQGWGGETIRYRLVETGSEGLTGTEGGRRGQAFPRQKCLHVKIQ